MVDYDKATAKVVIAIPEDTNSWPFYHQDEAVRAAAAKVPDPELVKTTRVKVGEQTTSTQDTTRRDTGGRRPGEWLSSLSTTSTSDKYEYHLEFVSATAGRVPNSIMSTRPAPTPTGPLDPAMKPVSGTATPGVTIMPAEGVHMPEIPPTYTPPGGSPEKLPPTSIGPIK
jgi:hypothetical protein